MLVTNITPHLEIFLKDKDKKANYMLNIIFLLKLNLIHKKKHLNKDAF